MIYKIDLPPGEQRRVSLMTIPERVELPDHADDAQLAMA